MHLRVYAAGSKRIEARATTWTNSRYPGQVDPDRLCLPALLRTIGYTSAEILLLFFRNFSKGFRHVYRDIVVR
jgi:hypothetical protein